MTERSLPPARSAASRDLTRRGLLGRAAAGGLGLSLLGRTAIAASSPAGALQGFGPLQPANADGLMLPAGFSSRVVAVTGTTVPSTSYVWHDDPDGGATFPAGPTRNSGWVYVSNSEVDSAGGGVGVLRFDADGVIVDAYSILSGTSRNCAGGPTPWGTWLSCEETSTGQVWECDPLSPGSQGVVRPAMGTFRHEAAAVDPVHQQVFLTEDRSDGLLYRFRPAAYPDLSSGVLEAAEILGAGSIQPGQTRSLAWLVVPDPTASGGTATRDQVPAATAFDGGEGCWYENGLVYFTTKGDDRVWRIDTALDEITIVYDAATSSNPVLTGVDNVYVSPCGDVYVAEDGGDLQIVGISPSGAVQPVVQLVGTSGTEITGPALSPDGRRLYFSSQRNPGRTYEVSGPWLGLQAVPFAGGLGHALTAAAVATAGAVILRRDARRAQA